MSFPFREKFFQNENCQLAEKRPKENVFQHEISFYFEDIITVFKLKVEKLRKNSTIQLGRINFNHL